MIPANKPVISHEADLAVEAVTDAALELESRRCYGRSAADMLAQLARLQATVNLALEALAAEASDTGIRARTS